MVIMKYNVGDAVLSISGRDAGKIYIILRSEGDYIYLANGIDRYAHTPKKKNVKHCKVIASTIAPHQLIRKDIDAYLHFLVTSVKKENSCQKVI